MELPAVELPAADPEELPVAAAPAAAEPLAAGADCATTTAARLIIAVKIEIFVFILCFELLVDFELVVDVAPFVLATEMPFGKTSLHPRFIGIVRIEIKRHQCNLQL